MPRRAATPLCLLAALLAAPSAASATDVVRPSSVSAATTVPAGSARTLTLSCSPRAVVLNAAVTRQGSGVTLRRSRPGAGAGDWSFRFAARPGATRRSVRAVLRCVRLALPSGTSGARLEVKTRGRSQIAVAPGGEASVRVGCGSAWAATGYAVNPGSRGDVRVRAAVADRHGWSFRLENAGAAPGRAAVSARCLRRAVTGRRGGRSVALEFAVARRERAHAIGPGSGTSVSHSCGRGHFSLAGGVDMGAVDGLELLRAHPAGPRAARWLFRRAGAGGELTTQLVCLSRRSRFR